MSKLAASLALLSQLVLGLSSTSGGSPVGASGIPGGTGFLEAAAPGLPVVATLPTFDAAPRLLARLAWSAGGVCPRRVTEGPGSTFQDETLARWARLERENPHREPSPLLGHRCRARGS